MKWIKLYIYRKMSQHQQLPGNPHNIRGPQTTRVSGSQDPTLWEYQCKSFNILSHNIVLYFFLLNFVELGYLEHQWYTKYNGHITELYLYSWYLKHQKFNKKKYISKRSEGPYSWFSMYHILSSISQILGCLKVISLPNWVQDNKNSLYLLKTNAQSIQNTTLIHTNCLITVNDKCLADLNTIC